jgi:hypothetical protein
MSPRALKFAVIAGAAAAYFLMFPHDLAAVDGLLRITQALPPGLYAVVVALIVVGGAVRIWGRRPSVP